MKTTIQHAELGELVYEENNWTGKKKLTQNGVELSKIDKRTFTTPNGETLTIKGNFLFGASLVYGTTETPLTSKIKWYEIVLAVLPFMLFIVWGNLPALCRIVPIVGGALGGAIGGLLVVLEIYLMRISKPLWLKIVIGVLGLGVAFGIGAGIGYAIVSAIS